LTALQFHITSPRYQLFQRSLQPTTAKEPKPTMTLTDQANKYSIQKDKNDKLFPCFLPQNYVLLCTESI